MPRAGQVNIRCRDLMETTCSEVVTELFVKSSLKQQAPGEIYDI